MKLSDIKNKKVYISGKMTGLSPEEIFKNFNSVEQVLVENNNGVMNPAITWHLLSPSKFNADEYLNISYAMMDVCDIVVVLPDWKTSSGAKKELSYANCIELDIYFLDEDGNLEKVNYEDIRY